ncbi:PfkB family carbohydrate kinase [Leucobacter sp. NPDC077196]|uniref:PfkB family carbohydrate kinase n=1 Tax=Leucobacter sp. NPDC077196 TaxID=3154959 RepID=UPI0034209271
MKILGFGDNIVDRFLDRRRDYPGGNAVNVAVYARRLGADAGYLGVFGDDPLARFLQSALSNAGVDHSRSIVRHGETGISTLNVIDGERVFLEWNDGGVTVREPIDLDDGRSEYAAGFDLVHSSVYSRTEPQLPRLRETRALVSFDFSSEPEFRSDAYISRVAPHIDLALLSCSDQSVEQTHRLLDTVIRAGAGIALATRGTDGAIVTDGTHRVSAPTPVIDDPATIVDTMGCGDAFVAGFMVELLRRGWNRHRPPSRDDLVAGLDAGNASSREQCFVESAFGGGRAIPIEDLQQYESARAAAHGGL